MTRKYLGLLAAIAILFSQLFIVTNLIAAPAPKEIRVGVILEPPFASYDQESNAYSGLTIMIWTTIADKLHWRYKFIGLPRDTENAMQQLKANKIDVVMGPVSITSKRLAYAEFSRPYLINHITFMTVKKQIGFLEIFSRIISQVLFNKIVLGLFIFITVLSHIIWLSERKTGSKYDKKYFPGIFLALFSIIDSQFSQAQRMGEPIATRTKSIFVLTDSIGTIGLAAITAVLASAVTVSLVETQKYDNPAQLRSQPVAVTVGSFEAVISKQIGARPVHTSSIAESVKLLKQGLVIGIIDDHAIIEYYIRSHNDNSLMITNLKLDAEEYAFVFSGRSHLTRPFNIELKAMQRNGELMEKICSEFLGSSEATYCAL